LVAIIEAEGIEPSDEEVREAVEEAAGDGPRSVSPKKLADSAIRSSALRCEQAQARDKRWTPDGDERGGTGQLWTPAGS
jgi:hypothetical protein